jgi:hypothetical protein
VEESDTAGGFAVVINGHSLVHALHPQMEKLFLEVSTQCEYSNIFYFDEQVYNSSLCMMLHCMKVAT